MLFNTLWVDAGLALVLALVLAGFVSPYSPD
jgi:hypothetical protein